MPRAKYDTDGVSHGSHVPLPAAARWRVNHRSQSAKAHLVVNPDDPEIVTACGLTTLEDQLDIATDEIKCKRCQAVQDRGTIRRLVVAYRTWG
jgi:hypothetical protein